MTAVPSGPLLFDTGIYIRYLRGEKYEWLGADANIFQRTILTAVVAAELYAGTRSQLEKRALDGLCRGARVPGSLFRTADTIVDGSRRVAAAARERFGQLDFVRNFRDVLIAMKALRNGSTLITENVADFARWKSVMGSKGKMLKVFEP